MGAALLAPSLQAVPPIAFRTPPSFPVGSSPQQIVVADLNRDGLPDLATANFNQHTVSVLLGQGSGSFLEAVHYPVGFFPDSLVVGDFNGDGKPDLATANGNGWNQPGTLSILLGNGDGTFAPPTQVTVDRGPRGIVAADFNGDGKLDLATAISGGWFETNQVNVLMGRGDGTFESPVSWAVGTAPAWIATGDFNGDGHPDLVVPNAGPGSAGTTLSVLINQGNGAFAPPATYTVGQYPLFVAVADLDQDGHPDLAVGNAASSSITLLFGKSDGTFERSASLSIPAGVSSLAVGDFNRDKIPDLAALGGSYDSGVVTVLTGQGDGTFLAPAPFTIGASLQTIAAGEFHGDAKLDLVVAGNYDNAVLLVAGNGDGTFKSTTDTYAVDGTIRGIITGDLNQDTRLDIATANLDRDAVSVLLQQPDGAFQPAVSYPTGHQPMSVKTADFNNDGRLDLVTANFDGTLTLLRGRTTAPGVFTNNWNVAGYAGVLTLGSNHNDVAVGDFNRDGNLDLVTPNYYGACLSVALGNGDGTFAPGPALPVRSGPTCVVVDDFNGDGKADIAVGYEGGFKISLLTGRGDGTFDPKTDIETWEIPWFIAAADINFDGKPDLVAAHYDWRRVSVMLNQTESGGPIAFAAPAMHDVANDPVCVAIGDFNGDNLPDIISANYASVSVLLGLGDGTFLTAQDYFVGGSWAAVGDFNQDGMPDAAMDLGGKVGLFWNDTLPRLQISPVPAGVRIAWPAWPFYTLEASTNVARADSWKAIDATPSTFANQFVLTNPVQSTARAFRLSRP